MFISLKAYRIEPLISEDYSSIEPVKLHRYDSPKFGYNESKKPSGRGWAGKLFKTAAVGFIKTTHAPERQSSSSAEESESTGDEGLVIVDQGPLSDEGRVLGAEGGTSSTDGGAGRLHSYFLRFVLLVLTFRSYNTEGKSTRC